MNFLSINTLSLVLISIAMFVGFGVCHDLLQEVKRQNLMAFPRVGRADNTWATEAATDSVANGLWWGPRLGRIQKRNFILKDGPWALISLKDFHLPSTRATDFTPRLGRELEEDNEEALAENERGHERPFGRD